MDIEFVNNLMDLSITLFSVFIGIGFSAFTLLFSFILNKKEYIKEINEEIATKGESVSMLRKLNGSVEYIKSLKSINSYIISLFSTSFISLIYAAIIKIFETCSCVANTIIFSVLIILNIALLIFTIARMLKVYMKITKTI